MSPVYHTFAFTRWVSEHFARWRASSPASLERTDAPREPDADAGSAWERRGLVVTADGPLHLDVVAGSIG